jgi:hypothetical protein
MTEVTATPFFVQATEKIDADLLLRLASNRCVWGTPGAYKGRGAPCKHGHKLKLNDPETWPEVTETLEVEDLKFGRVKVMRWSGFHFLQSPNRAMEIIRVEVIQPVGRYRKFQPLWLAWLGQTMPALEDIWHKYLRRFTRFALVSICEAEVILDTTTTRFYSGSRAME